MSLDQLHRCQVKEPDYSHQTGSAWNTSSAIFFYIPSLTNRKTFLLSLCPYNFSLLLEKTVILKVKDPLEDFSANYHLSVPDFCSDAGDTVSLLFSQME